MNTTSCSSMHASSSPDQCIPTTKWCRVASNSPVGHTNGRLLKRTLSARALLLRRARSESDKCTAMVEDVKKLHRTKKWTPCNTRPTREWHWLGCTRHGPGTAHRKKRRRSTSSRHLPSPSTPIEGSSCACHAVMLLRKATGERSLRQQPKPNNIQSGTTTETCSRPDNVFPKASGACTCELRLRPHPPSVTSRHTVPTCSVRLRASAARRYHSQRQRSAGKNHIYFQTWKKHRSCISYWQGPEPFFEANPNPSKLLETVPPSGSLLSCPLLLPVKKGSAILPTCSRSVFLQGVKLK